MSSRLNENHIYSTEKLNIKFQEEIMQFNNLGMSIRETFMSFSISKKSFMKKRITGYKKCQWILVSKNLQHLEFYVE